MATRSACLVARERWLRAGAVGDPSEEAEVGGLIVAEDGWNLARLRASVDAMIEGLGKA